MTSRSRKLAAALAVCSLGTLLQGGVPGGCYRAVFELGLNSFDSCAVLNCETGTFFDFCSPVAILVDCPTIPDTDTP